MPPSLPVIVSSQAGDLKSLDVTQPSPFILEFPSAQDEEIQRRFTVTYHYLLELYFFLTNTYGRGADLEHGISKALRAHAPFLKIQRKPKNPVPDSLRRHLELAWTAEITLRLPASISSDAAFRYSNAWAPVHSYYASYMLLQAWFAANNMSGLADDHTATLRSISEQILRRQLLPAPWSVLANGNVLAGECVYVNEPTPGACSKKVQVLSRPIGLPGGWSEAEFWGRLGTWLRTTREARLAVKEDEWKRKKHRQRIDPAVRKQFAGSLHPTSMFDCLWRLRIRSNYRSVETYLTRFVGDEDAKRFHHSLVRITRANLFLLECYVARMIGAGAFEEIATIFLKRDPGELVAKTVGRRLPVVLATAAKPPDA